jgi:putative oxidoreductase
MEHLKDSQAAVSSGNPIGGFTVPLNAVLLLLRVTNGSIFMAHGWDKILDVPKFVQGLAGLGVPFAGFFGPLVAGVEFLGGLLLLLGVLSRLAALGHTCTMLVAILTVHKPWLYGLTSEQGMQFPLSLLAGSLVLLVLGGGAYSVGRLLSRGRRLPRAAWLSKWRRIPAIAVLQRYTGVLLVVLAAASSLLLLMVGQSCSPSSAYGNSSNEQAATAEVVSAERELWSRFKKHDVEGMLEMMDRDFTAFSGGMPKRLDGPAAEEAHARYFLDDLKGEVLRYDILDPRVQNFGDVAVLTYHFAVNVTMLGKMQAQTGKDTSVWVRRGKTWKQVHYHYDYLRD